jgi:hypothetical protein
MVAIITNTTKLRAATPGKIGWRSDKNTVSELCVVI